MADIVLALSNMDRAGTVPTFRTSWDANDDYFFPNTGHEFILAVQGTGESTLTVKTFETRDGNAVADKPVTLVANGQTVIGPFTKRVQNIYENEGRQISFAVDGAGMANLAVAIVHFDLNT